MLSLAKYIGERKQYYVGKKKKKRVTVHSEWYQPLEDMEVHMHTADKAIFVEFWTCRTKFHPVRKHDVNGRMIPSEYANWDLIQTPLQTQTSK